MPISRSRYELHVSNSARVATVTVERMTGLWDVEARVRGQTPDLRVAAKLDASSGIVADFFKLWQETLARIRCDFARCNHLGKGVKGVVT